MNGQRKHLVWYYDTYISIGAHTGKLATKDESVPRFLGDCTRCWTVLLAMVCVDANAHLGTVTT